jgi:hypothetical protein
MSTSKTRVLDLSRSTDRTFVHLLVNTLLVSVINFTVWFAITFGSSWKPSRCWQLEWSLASSW